MDEVKESMDMAANHGQKMLKCVSSDGVVMEIDEELLKKSNVVKEMIDVLKPPEEDVVVPVQIHSTILKVVLDFLKLANPSHRDKLKLLNGRSLESIYAILTAASYLDIEDLRSVCAEAITIGMRASDNKAEFFDNVHLPVKIP